MGMGTVGVLADLAAMIGRAKAAGAIRRREEGMECALRTVGREHLPLWALSSLAVRTVSERRCRWRAELTAGCDLELWVAGDVDCGLPRAAGIARAIADAFEAAGVVLAFDAFPVLGVGFRMVFEEQ